MSDKSHILVIDDEKNYLLVLQTLLEDEGYTVTAISDPETALAFLAESEVDVVVTDMKMPKVSGREVLQHVKKSWPYIPVLIMTAFGSIESAVEAMKYGAFDYITKPFSNDELLLSIHNATELARAHRQYRLLQEAMEERYSVHQIVGRSRAIRDVLVMVDRAAPSRSTVLITGESGTGKELVARAIHYASPRKEKPFVSVNCMALNPGVLESELFGHEKGSFTGAVAMRRGRFEQADGGTLFLDEIAELTPDLQVKLLRVLQERRFERVGGGEEIEVDIRVVAATNKDLAAMVEKGTFRDDLYYRLNVVQIPLPALRERREDIPLLVAHFMDKVARENDMPAKKFTTDALNYLSGYEWWNPAWCWCPVRSSTWTTCPPRSGTRIRSSRAPWTCCPCSWTWPIPWRRSRPPSSAVRWYAPIWCRSRPPSCWASPRAFCSTSSRNTPSPGIRVGKDVCGGGGKPFRGKGSPSPRSPHLSKTFYSGPRWLS